MAIKEKELIGMLLPSVSIDEITLETKKSADNKEGLKVTLNFSVYDVVENNEISKWFDQIDMHSFIRIRLFEQREGLLAASRGFNLSDLEQEASNNPLTYSNRLARTREVDQNGRFLNYYKFSRSYDYDYCPMNLAYSISAQLNITAINARFGTELTDAMTPEGNNVTSREVVFQDGNLGTSKIYILERSGLIWNGPRHRMEEENSDESPFEFRNPATPEDVFMTGATHDELSELLISRTIKNYKIQDFRTFTEIEKFEIDDSIFHNLQEEISPAQRSSIENLKKDFYSEIWLSRSLSGEAKLMFAIDLKEMIRNRGIFGKLMDNMPEIMQRDILSHCKIQSIKLLRRRVRETNVHNKLGTQAKGYTNFDKIKKHDALVMSGETRTPVTIDGQPRESFKRIDGDHASIRESMISTDEIKPSIRFFTATDKSMKKITDGFYQYGIEVSVIDGTRKFLIEMKNSLLDARNGLIEILEKMNRSQPVNDYVYDPVTNTYIRNFTFSEDEKEKILKVFRSYVKIMSAFDSLDPELFVALMAIYKSPTYTNQVIKSMDSIISKLERITNDESIYFDPSQIEFQRTGRISSSERFTINDSKFFTNHTFDSNVDKGKGLEFLVNPTDERAGNILQNLREPTDLEIDLQERARDVSQDLGFSRQGAEIGLRIIDSVEWQQRVQAEIDKFYSSPNPSFSPPNDGETAQQEESVRIDGINSSYLTPSFILLESEVTDPINLEINSSEEKTLQSEEAILTSNEGERDYFSQMGVSFYEESEEALLINEQIGINKIEKIQTCAISNRYIRQVPIDALKGWYVENGVVKILGTEGLPPEEESNPSGQSRSILTKITDIRQQPPISKTHKFGVNNFTRIFKESIVKDVNRDLKFGDYEQPVHPVARFKEFSVLPKSLKKNFKNLPLQIQSLFLLESDASKVKFFESQPSPSRFRINYNFLFAVEYLSGFGDDNLHFENGRQRKNFKMIKEPVWKPLTVQKFLASRGEEMLCRLKKSTIKELGVKVQENLDLPAYDSYFIIRPPAMNEGEIIIDRLEESLRRAEEQELIRSRGMDFARQLQADLEMQQSTAFTIANKNDAQRRWDELTREERKLEIQIRDVAAQRDEAEVRILEGSSYYNARQEAEIAYNLLDQRLKELRKRLREIRAEKQEITATYGITRRSAEAVVDAYMQFLRDMAYLEYLRNLEEEERRLNEERREEREQERQERQRAFNFTSMFSIGSGSNY